MLKFLILGSFSFAAGGGVGRVSRTLASELVRQGHECCFLATQSGEKTEVEGIPQYFVPGNSVDCIANRRYVQQLVNERSIDVIINQAGFTCPSFRLLLPVLDRCVVITAHHNCVACLQDKHHSIISNQLSRLHLPARLRPDWLMRALKARSRRKTANAIEFISSKGDAIVLLAEEFIDEISVFTERVRSDRLLSIPNPCPFKPDESALIGKEKAILYVGRLENGQKRVDRLLNVWRILGDRFPDWRLDIVGDGADASKLEAMARQFRLRGVTFHGQCDPESFYRKASVLMLSSDFEGFGMVLVEAQAFGCIPVASECFSSIRGIIEDGVTGFIVEPDDIEAYAEKAGSIMLGSVAVEGMRRSALSKARSFQPERIAQSWIDTASLLVEKKFADRWQKGSRP